MGGTYWGDLRQVSTPILTTPEESVLHLEPPAKITDTVYHPNAVYCILLFSIWYPSFLGWLGSRVGTFICIISSAGHWKSPFIFVKCIQENRKDRNIQPRTLGHNVLHLLSVRRLSRGVLLSPFPFLVRFKSQWKVFWSFIDPKIETLD